MKKPLAIIKAGSAMEAVRQRFGDFEDWLLQGIGSPEGGARLIRPPWPRAGLPPRCCRVCRLVQEAGG